MVTQTTRRGPGGAGFILSSEFSKDPFFEPKYLPFYLVEKMRLVSPSSKRLEAADGDSQLSRAPPPQGPVQCRESSLPWRNKGWRGWGWLVLTFLPQVLPAPHGHAISLTGKRSQVQRK